MAKQRHLANAPIREALLDFRAVLPPDFSVAEFEALKERVAPGYPVAEEYRRLETQVQLTDGAPTAIVSPPAVVGHLFKSRDGCDILQFRANGFTLNRLQPYTRWEALLPKALEWWRVYLEIAQPTSVPRIAVRYINHLRASPLDSLPARLTRVPAAPHGAPGVIREFLSRSESHDAVSSISSIVTQAVQPDFSSSGVSVLLDIDASKAGEFVAQADLQPAFESLRQVKNQVFFESITEAEASTYE